MKKITKKTTAVTKKSTAKNIRTTSTSSADKSTAKSGKSSAKRIVTVAPVKETFTTGGGKPETVKVARNSVVLLINGRDKGVVDTTGTKMREFVEARAKAAGIRTFTVYLDGQKANTSMGGMPMSRFGKVEILAKDSRGGRGGGDGDK